MTLVPLPEPQWYAGIAWWRHEIKAASWLSARGCRTFVPIERVRTLRRVPGRERKEVRIIDRPLMAPYFFVGIHHWADFAHITNCRFVRGVVSFGGDPVRVPDDVIDELMAADDERAKAGVLRDEVKRKPFRRGQAVRLRAGHMFADFIAEIEVIEDQGNKVRAWAEMFRSRREVEFKPSDLEMVS